MKITTDLKNTLISRPHIQEVHFDKFGNHFFNAHIDEKTGKKFHRILDLSGKEVVVKNGVPVQVDVRRYEANPDHEIVKTLSSKEVLATPIEKEAPKFDNKEAAAIYEQQAQEIAKLKAQLEDKELEKAIEAESKSKTPQLPLGSPKK